MGSEWGTWILLGDRGQKTQVCLPAGSAQKAIKMGNTAGTEIAIKEALYENRHIK